MKMKFAIAAILAASTLPVLAHNAPGTTTPRINEREQRQDERIQQGELSGSLNNREAARLEKGQAHIDNMQAKAAANGSVSRHERKRLRHAEDVQSRHIKQQKHDRQHDYNHNGMNDHRH